MAFKGSVVLELKLALKRIHPICTVPPFKLKKGLEMVTLLAFVNVPEKRGTMSRPLGDGELQKCASEVLVPQERCETKWSFLRN